MGAIIDTQVALEQAAGNEELAKELLAMLLNELPVLNAKLLLAIQQHNNTAMWDHAHKLYGSTAYCGVPALRQSAKALEDAIKQQQLQLIHSAHGNVCSEIDKLLQEGPQWLQRNWN